MHKQYVQLVDTILLLQVLVQHVVLALLSALPAMLVRRVQRVLLVLLLLLQTELLGLPQLQIVRIYFDYNYI